MTYPTTTIAATAEFRDDTGTLFDPTTVYCRVTAPSGVQTTYSYGSSPNLTKTGTGKYKCVYDVDEPGTWYEYWYGADSAGSVAYESSLTVSAVR